MDMPKMKFQAKKELVRLGANLLVFVALVLAIGFFWPGIHGWKRFALILMVSICATGLSDIIFFSGWHRKK